MFKVALPLQILFERSPLFLKEQSLRNILRGQVVHSLLNLLRRRHINENKPFMEFVAVVASHMLSLATDADYIIYHSTIYDALMDLFPIFEGQLASVTDGVSYMCFQLAYDVIIQTYKFISIQELHEFLWHGKDTEWTFEEK